MPIPLQAVMLLCAGYALWRLWRLTDNTAPLLRYLIAGGFLIRAFASQLLFWVSYLELPFGRSLQLGHGLWFFAIDAGKYLGPAVRAAQRGLLPIFQIEMTQPSIVFIRTLGVFAWAFGYTVSIAILLNVAVYLGMSILIVRWAARHNVPTMVTAIPLFAIGYLPSWILWALQPLKDAFFCFLIVLFAFACDSFVAAWKRPRGERLGAIAGSVLLILATTYLLAGVRWYYAAIAIATASVVFLSILFVARGAREVALRAVVLVLLAFTAVQVFVVSGGPYVPRQIRGLAQPWTREGKKTAVVTDVVEVVEDSRRNLDRYTSAGTVIRSGRLLSETSPAQSTSTPATTTAPSAPSATTTTTATPAPAATAVTTAPRNPNAPPPTFNRQLAREFSEEGAPKATLPQTPQKRMIAGAAALLLPRSIAVKLGLVSIGGGRGMMWFAELDTILFDIVILVVTGIVIASLRRGAWRDPFVWYLILVSVTIAGAIAYTISNYGTLLRHRGMLVATAVLLAIAVRRCAEEKSEEEAILAAPSEMPSR